MWNHETQSFVLDSIIPKLLPEVIPINDAMAKNPELGSQEYESARMLVELLKSHGLPVEFPFAGIETAFKAQINAHLDKRVALLVEYDALPDIGHACGHCASGCASVLAGISLAAIAQDLDVGIDIIGTPDEELTGWKCVMADAGIFDHYAFAAMVHMGGVNTVDVDFIALDGLSIKFHGAPAHAAIAPETGRNALNAARLFFDATDMMRQHIIPQARLHGYIKQGGVASNIVPDLTEIEFLSRAPRRKDLTPITEWVKDCAKAAALATRTEYEISKAGEPFHDLYISPIGREVMLECFHELNLPVVEAKGAFVGSSDVGNVDYVCPAFQPVVSIGQKFLCHTREFAQAMTTPLTHEAIGHGAKVLVKLVFKLCGSPERLAAVQQAHQLFRTS